MEFLDSKTLMPESTASAIANAIPIWELLNMTEKEYYEKYHKTEQTNEE